MTTNNASFETLAKLCKDGYLTEGDQRGSLLQYMPDCPSRIGYEFWLSLCNGNKIPKEKDLRPEAIPPICFEHIGFFEVIDGGADFMAKIFGEKVSDWQVLKTKELVSTMSERVQVSSILTRFRDVVEHRFAALDVYEFVHVQGFKRHLLGLVCPLANEAGEVTKLFAVGSPFELGKD
ncbi:hypothetical protein [Sneathiella limimaris]|uniref:hypothetical protein n=1 Tax=Sneathiella limimaris TaxID=1964213 RepID=UPI00146D46A6|nr:hypothetical protein [Sneathiella limimaris]